MATVKLIRLAATIIVFTNLAGKSLKCSSRQEHQQLAQMRAAMGSAKKFTNRLAESAKEVKADDAPISRRNGVAIPWIRRGIRTCLSRQNVHFGIDGDTNPQIVDRLPGPTQAGGQGIFSVLDIDEARFNVPHPVDALKSVELNGASMQAFTRCAGGRKWHDFRLKWMDKIQQVNLAQLNVKHERSGPVENRYGFLPQVTRVRLEWMDWSKESKKRSILLHTSSPAGQTVRSHTPRSDSEAPHFLIEQTGQPMEAPCRIQTALHRCIVFLGHLGNTLDMPCQLRTRRTLFAQGG